jgi:glutamate carboxypeptidase
MMTERAILDWLAPRREEMIALLAQIVNIDGGSYDKAGVDRVGRHLRDWLERAGIACEVTPFAAQGDVLHAHVPGGGASADDCGGGAGNAPALLMGHMDTVFPPGEALRRPFSIIGDRGHGPGCADMKAGLVMNAFVLRAFAETGGAPAPLHGLFTGDEEIGSPASRPIIEAAAARACAVFNAEPGRANGNIVDGRRGGAFLRVTIAGRAAHAGLNPADGRSAIHELGRKIVAWHGLNDAVRDISVNVGLVSGGQSVNTIAPCATAEIDLRFSDPGDEARMAAAIASIAHACAEDGLSARIETLGSFSPMARNDGSAALTALYLAAAAALGQGTAAEFTRSCADSGVASATGTPTVCALGPVGGHAHSPEEYVELGSLVPRAQALALAIMRLGG